mmetsp:Transcript_91590/g.248453  ORF Transcript_91590/g.248453 Transcript_91590/m.248453 type:complete len:90 (+) Transcript_91590:36-305(+)
MPLVGSKSLVRHVALFTITINAFLGLDFALLLEAALCDVHKIRNKPNMGPTSTCHGILVAVERNTILENLEAIHKTTHCNLCTVVFNQM